MDKQQQQEEKRFALVSLDESFFFYDSLVRGVWIDKEKRHVVRVTGSHKYPHMYFRSLESGRKTTVQTVRQVQWKYVPKILNAIHGKFPKCHLFMDKDSPHQKSKKV